MTCLRQRVNAGLLAMVLIAPVRADLATTKPNREQALADFRRWYYQCGEPPAKEALDSLREWWEQHRDDAEVECALAMSRDQGLAGEPDPQQINSMLENAAAQGYPLAQAYLGALQVTGQGVPLNREHGLQLLRKAADNNESEAFRQLGFLYMEGKAGLEPDPTAALTNLLRANSLGNKRAACFLGALYNRLENRELAIKWMRQGAEAGDPQAQAALGSWFRIGRNVQKDERQAFHWMQRAAQSARPEFKRRLAEMYEQGIGAEKDTQAALQLYTEAGEHGDPESATRVATFYLQGKYVPVDVSRGLHILRQVANRKYPPAQRILGQAYLAGEWMPRDVERARTLLAEAARAGDEEATSELARLRDQ